MSFWGKVTGTEQVPARPPALPPQGYPHQQYQPMLPNQYQPQTYPQQQYQTEDQERLQATMRKAPSSRSTLTCPDCGSDHIMKPSANVMEQCYTCGWNPRYTQSTAGAGMPSTAETGPPRPARQISTGNNYNPGQIVGTVTL